MAFCSVFPSWRIGKQFFFREVAGSITITLVLLMSFLQGSAQSRVIDSLRTQLAIHETDTIGIRILMDLGSELSRSNLQKSREYLYQGIRQSNRLNTTYGISAFYSQLTTSYQNTAQLDSARKYLSLLKEMAERNKTIEAQSNYHMTAGLFYKNSSQFDLALPHMLKALTYMTDKKHAVNYAGQLLNIGNTYTNIGDIKKAAYYHLEGLKRFEQLGNKRGESFCLQSLGNDFLKLKRFDESKRYYERSQKLKEELNDARGLVSAWNGLGNVFGETGNNVEALRYYSKALAQCQQLKLQSEESKALYDIGLIQTKLKNLTDAKAALLTALPLARQRGDSLLSSKITAALVNLEEDKNKSALVEKGLLKKLERARHAGDQNVIADGYYDLAELHFKNKQFEDAYGFLKKHQALADSLRGKDVSVKLMEMQQQYESEKKEKEIALLKKDQQLTQAVIAKQTANQQIIVITLIAVVILASFMIHYYRMRNRAKRKEELEKMRNVIARDLHDDIGSALSSIHIMSQLAIKTNGNAPDHLQRISDSAARMMEGMSDIVWSINPENDSLEKLVFKMKEFAGEILEPKNITYSFEIGPNLAGVKLDVEKRKNLFLIFKESLNNAAKYSEGSEVTIKIQSQGDTLQLSIRDNGKGFEATTVRYGNGLLNMAERAKNVNGRLIQNASPGLGTEIIAELPLA
jgi:two-component system, NarL family, sensor histidine kinase UhpB